jgi:hypothetical protein
MKQVLNIWKDGQKNTLTSLIGFHRRDKERKKEGRGKKERRKTRKRK